MSSSDRQRLIEAMLARYRQILERRLPHGPQTIDQIEQAVEEISQELERELEQRILDQQPPPADNRARCPHCGASARFRGLQERCLLTRHGERRLHRRYYYCSACQEGFAPLDLALGLGRSALTAQLRRQLAYLAAWQPFAEAVVTLQLLTGLPVSAKTVERAAHSVGQSLGEAKRRTAQQHLQGRLPQPTARPRQLYVSMDGVFVPLRDPWKRDGSLGQLSCRFGECKVGAVYEVRAGPDGRLQAHRAVYTATLDAGTAFEPLIATLAHQQGHHFAREVIVLGDGAAWIWRIAAAQFPRAIEIVDFCHASQHLWKIAAAWFGPKSPEAGSWVEQRKAELLKDELAAVLEAIGTWEPTSENGQKLKQTEYDYFARNAERMRYGTFRRKGYQIASGVVESACKHVVASRLDQAGMHWRQETAEAIVCLRAAIRSTPTPDRRPDCLNAA
jgi:hypothetical protein